MKKLLALMLALMLCFGTAAFAEESVIIHADRSTLPFVENYGDVTLRFLVTEHPALIDWATNEFIVWMNEQTNVKIEFEGVSSQSRTEKLNLILASGDLPDVFCGVYLTDNQIAQYGVNEGLLMPLNDLIQENAPLTQQVFEYYPLAEKLLTQLDGNIYTLPNVNECYHCRMYGKGWINQKWLDTLGLEMPTTLDELYDVLVAFRDQDPNGNGIQDELPAAGNHIDGSHQNLDEYFINAFTYYDNCMLTTEGWCLYVDKEGNVSVPFYKDEFKEGLRFMNKLVNENLYYVGSFSQNREQLTQLVENPSANLVGMVGGHYLGACSQLGGERYQEYRPMMPMIGPEGFQNAMNTPYDLVTEATYVLSADCPYPEIAIKWGDFCLDFEATSRGYYGVKDVDWREATADEVGINGKPALYTQITPWQESDPQNIHVCQQIPAFRSSDYRLGMTYDPSTSLYSSDGLEAYLYYTTVDYAKYSDENMFIPKLKFTDEEKESMMVMKTELNTAIKEGLTAFMTGAKSVDADYDAFLAELESKGLNELLANYQAAYDSQYR